MASKASKPTSKPLRFMDRLSDQVYLYRPEGANPDPSDPKLIVVFPWMEAVDAHIAKYVQRFQAIFPTSTIVLAKYPVQNWYQISKMRKQMGHVFDVIELTAPYSKSEPEDDPQVYFHIMSNGGAINFRHLVDLSHERGLALPMHVKLLDSSPSQTSLKGAWVAFTAVVPPWMKFLVPFLLLTSLVLSTVFLGEPTPMFKMLAALNSDQSIRHEKRRAYVFSDGDALVPGDHVRKHISESKEKGIEVQAENFGKSAHVQHMRSDTERYWNIVRQVWGSRAE